MPPAVHYKVRVLRDVSRNLLIPCVTAALVLYSFGRRSLDFLSIPLYIVAIVIHFVARVKYANFVDEGEARKLNARLVPRVVGKLPGNIDIMLRLMRARHDRYLLDGFFDLFYEYQTTTLNLRFLWQDKIITMDHEHIRYIYTHGFDVFWKGDTMRERMECFLGAGILNRDDEEWKTHRSLARPFFARNRFSDLQIFERHTQRVISLITSSPSKVWDAQDLYTRFSIDAGSEFLFGSSPNALEYDSSDVGEFNSAFDKIQELVLKRNLMGSLWPFLEFLEDKSQPYAKIIDSWMEPVVRRALEYKRKAESIAKDEKNTDQMTFLEYLADNTEDMAVIRDQLKNIQFASRDTTSSLLTLTTYLLATHPNVMKKMREEVLENLGPDRFPTIADIKTLKYMKAVLKEALRLFPPVPMASKETRYGHGVVMPLQDCTFVDTKTSGMPMYIPPGTAISTVSFLMHRNSALWGDDVFEFIPERWIEPERIKEHVQNPTRYLPFSAGPRVCLGQDYALNETSFFLVRMLQHFEKFTLVEEEQTAAPWMHLDTQLHCPDGRRNVEKIWVDMGLILFIRGGLRIRYERAEG